LVCGTGRRHDRERKCERGYRRALEMAHENSPPLDSEHELLRAFDSDCFDLTQFVQTESTAQFVA
jgi:hypothetical protein